MPKEHVAGIAKLSADAILSPLGPPFAGDSVSAVSCKLSGPQTHVYYDSYSYDTSRHL